MTNLRVFLARTAVLTMAVLKSSHGFYVPGVRPYEFAPGEEVPMKVNALTSIHTQVRRCIGFLREVALHVVMLRKASGVGIDSFFVC